MALLPRISSKLPPDIDPTKAPIAYGRRGLPKLNEELEDPDLLTRQRALMALCDLVHDPENVYEAIRLGFLDNLKMLLLDDDSTVRQKTTEVLYIMATHSVGRTGFLENGVIPALAQLLDDPVDICRWNMHYALKLVSELPLGATGIVESGLVPSLVFKLKTELEDIQELILETLTGCLRVEAFEALATGAVHILKELLSHSGVNIRSRAAQALMAISVPLEGKNMVFEEDVFPDLVMLLEDEDAEVRANAAGALMNSAITTQGKYAAINADAIDTLLPLIHDERSKVRLYSIKALTMLSEAPEGRKILLGHVAEFRKRLSDSSPAVRRAAQIAVEVIEWKP
ncbi:radial spoke head 14 homolog [Podarcis raffonei]|uniref:Radial spoke head 14 homolog n=1 Tax=Podarcis muralis TaxID=64176 RepID=A0A670JVE8_PODMU|nr:radial spoke head 14 homolog [Podarcis muralis]XP_053226211.1 radial spoke head 14 homolog [Podarcis raffonei]XP_053226212.1 radial spoke head 14 homolog [Podarcis raffonei]XP_053226213.1 radial spoke head 14 homolog [Podarcis raffonei]XP_053226214.1 radial spoke head 14 homolog [Podarcis raffonei]